MGAVVAAVVWTRPSTASIATGQVVDLLPPGSSLHSLARVDLDGRPPLEIGAIASVPRLPGSHASTYYEFIVAYDPWRRRVRRVYERPLSGPLPLSVDAGRILVDREAVIFPALHDDGRRSYRVVGIDGRGIRVLHEGQFFGRLVIADSLVIEDGDRPQAWLWDGRALRARPAPEAIPPARPGVTWRYRVWGNAVRARTTTVQVRARQTLRLVPSGGGPGAIVFPDSRFDLVENGYRARTPGIYRVRILIPFDSDDRAFVLTVVVTDEGGR